MSESKSIFVLDDEKIVAQATTDLLRAISDFEVVPFTSARDLLDELRADCVSCILSDLVMPDIDGRELMERVSLIDDTISFVFISGNAAISDAVELVRGGAITFLEKPFQKEKLLSAVNEAMERHEDISQINKRLRDMEERFDRLSNEEHDVMQCIVLGLSNKEAAYRLGMSSRTFDRRRKKILEVIEAKTSAELASKIERYHAQSLISKPSLRIKRAKHLGGDSTQIKIASNEMT